MQFYRKKGRTMGVPIVPMIDILTILLIFFIVHTQWKKPQTLLKIDVPGAEFIEGAPSTEQRAVLAVTEESSISLNGYLVEIDELPAALERLKKENPARLLEDWQKAHELPDSEAMDRLVCTAVFHATMAEVLDVLLLGQEGDLARSGGKRYRSGAVRVMTLHGSKGLEFPVVFLCGVTREWLPLDSPGRPADPAEERRLFYVGMTRAKEALYLLTSRDPSP